jgi:hypothetical protein
VPEPVTVGTSVPPAVEVDRSTSAPSKPVTASANFTSNEIGATEVGSA